MQKDFDDAPTPDRFAKGELTGRIRPLVQAADESAKAAIDARNNRLQRLPAVDFSLRGP